MCLSEGMGSCSCSEMTSTNWSRA